MIAATREIYGIQALVQKAVRDKSLSRHEHLRLTTAILSNSSMAATDRFHINRLLDYVRAGKVRLIDE